MAKSYIRLKYKQTTTYNFDKRLRTQINSIFNTNAQVAADELKLLSPRGVSDTPDSLAENWRVIRARRQTIGTAVEVKIENSSTNAYDRIFGRRPGGMPPEQPLERWVRGKVFQNQSVSVNTIKKVTYSIRRKIAEEGTERWRTNSNPLGLNRDLSAQAGSPISDMEDRIEAELNELSLY